MIKPDKVTYIIALLILVTLSIGTYKYFNTAHFTISCGVGHQEGNQFYVDVATHQVLFKTHKEDPYQRFGCSVIAPDTVFKLKADLVLPSIKTVQDSDGALNQKQAMLRFKEAEVRDRAGISVSLDENDKEGTYYLTLYINGDKAVTQSFDVYRSY